VKTIDRDIFLTKTQKQVRIQILNNLIKALFNAVTGTILDLNPKFETIAKFKIKKF